MNNSVVADTLIDLFDLQGKVVLITGASSGIGRHAALLFAKMGCEVVLAARREQKVVDITKEINRGGGSAFGVVMDVNDRESVERAIGLAVDRFGGIDVLINNAGIARTARFLEMSEEDWRAVLDTNLDGVWRVAQVVAQQMIGQKSGGAVVNIASVLGLKVQRQQANYSAAKSAVIQLTRSMALELGRKGVRVNVIAPGYFETEINREFFRSERGQVYVENLFPGRPGELEELNGVLLLLASGAGSYMNGSVLTVDGGSVLGKL